MASEKVADAMRIEMPLVTPEDAARMPEAKMETLINAIVDQTARALQQGCKRVYFAFSGWIGEPGR